MVSLLIDGEEPLAMCRAGQRNDKRSALFIVAGRLGVLKVLKSDHIHFICEKLEGMFKKLSSPKVSAFNSSHNKLCWGALILRITYQCLGTLLSFLLEKKVASAKIKNKNIPVFWLVL